MKKMRRLVAGAALTGLLFAVAAAAEEPSSENAALKAEVEALQERLTKLEALLQQKLESGDSDSTPPAPTPAARRTVNPKLLPPGVPVTYEATETALVKTQPLPAAPIQAEPQDEIPVGAASTGGQLLTITGIIDTYLTYNANDPQDGTNTLYYTNPNSRGFGLNQAKLEIDASGDGPVGFRTDLWFGSGARLFRDGLEPGPLEDVIYLQQAYGYYLWDNGANLDVGLFGTIAGLEVAESHLNWNYTRGILWAWNEPFSHLGARFSAPITDTLTGTVMLVNGFDNAFDQNSGKSYGVQGSWAPSDRFNTTLTWIHGPENELTNDGWLRDVSWNFYGGLHEKFEIMANLDWISNTDPFGNTATSWGVGGYARFSPTEKFRIAQRYEYFDDLEARSTGVEQILREYTLTFEYAPEPRFITRFEWRHDWGGAPFFSCGMCGPLDTPGFKDNQSTFTVGMMYVMGPE